MNAIDKSVEILLMLYLDVKTVWLLLVGIMRGRQQKKTTSCFSVYLL